MQTAAKGPQDGPSLLHIYGGSRKKKVFLYFSSGTTLIKLGFDYNYGDGNGYG